MFNDKQGGIAVGAAGEEIAAKFLLTKKYKILYRNYRKPWGELDIIAKDPNGTLVFVEVKTLRCLTLNNPLTPEDNMTVHKLRKTKRAAEMFVGKHSDLLEERVGWRIDLVSICLTSNKHEIHHYENV